MVQHAMDFLRRIAKDLPALNAVDPNLWYYGDQKESQAASQRLGTRLAEQVTLALKLHEKNILMDALRQGIQLT